MREPVIGEKVYIGNSYSIGHGEDDIDGGIATIVKVTRWDDCANPYNRLFVYVAEAPGHGYNWLHLMENQERWAKCFSEEIAKPSPDYYCYECGGDRRSHFQNCIDKGW